MSIQGAGCVNANSVVGGGCPYKIDRGVCNDVLCDVSIQKMVCNEKMVCSYKREWVNLEWKGRRTTCPYK